MRRLLSGFGLLLLLASPLAGQTNPWKQYKNAEGNFTVLFSGDPTDTPNSAAGGVRSHTLMAKDGGALYTVVYTSMDSDQKVDEATFVVFKDAVFRELPKCDLISEHPPAPGLGGYIGHWYRLSCEMPNKITIVGNLYWGKRYAYAVMAMFPADTAEPTKLIKTFVDSFAVLDPGK
ncbi:MAG TPA: hypothetical protein VGH51_16225 [Candidatus Angelobacter sp.]|jgi:hypothetical protein